ncbi:hypothetical protein SteCoe_952 [Stentor coeruleus]|uniref:Uncharacterized protein n=1 Tax=Stentor coeruleus TaxID=5963 RepID=A0A1R2D2V6_9CILI|nr:hypothetical protein SteCoe_952 [Stentor coeruleus]
MEIKRNCSEKNLIKSVADTDKINPLVTFQRFPVSPNPALYVHPSMPNIANIDELKIKHPAWTTKFFENRGKNFSILPPIANAERFKLHENSRDVFARVLLRSDHHTKRKQKVEEEKTNNLSYSEKKYQRKPSKIIKYCTEGDLDENFNTPREENLHFITDLESIPTPKFRNSIAPESLAIKFSEIDTFDKEADNVRSKSEVIRKSRSHTHLLRTTFKAVPRKYTCKLASDIKRIMSNNLPCHIKNGHQKIKVLKHGLPKDVFTVDGKSGYK